MFCLEKDFAARQIVGTRKRQEDYYSFAEFVEDEELGSGVLLVIADGMGGHFGGSLASRRSTQVFLETFRRESGSVRQRMRVGLEKANDSLVAPDDGELLDEDDPAVTFMGTTLLAMGIFDGGLHWISVGDSPAYLLRNGNFERLNEDHSFRPVIEKEVDEGRITVQEALVHPDRNTLRSALTGYPMELIDSPETPTKLQEGDVVLCATDGLFSLEESAVAEVLENHTGRTAAVMVSELLRVIEAKQHRFQDNTTAAVLFADAFLP
ncbi:MAG: protein phosphatase 2C domain-containing protein [Verrucomicrobiota bacterium]